MFRNYLAAALRNLARNPLYAGINIIGLAVGFAAAIFAALFVRDELTFDHWIPGHEQVYGITTTYAVQQAFAPQEYFRSHRDAAAWLKADFPQVKAVTRYLNQGQNRGQTVLHHGDVRDVESAVLSADVNFFSVVQFPAVAGDLQTAFDQPDGIVLTRNFARKYFGRDAPIGETIELDEHPMRVTAVIEDLPSNTSFTGQAFISERASFSSLRRLEALPSGPENDPALLDVGTFIRLKAGVSIDALQQAMPEFVAEHMPAGLLGQIKQVKMRLFPLVSLHLFPFDNVESDRARTQLLTAIYGVAGFGILIILAAGINFVNLMTARAARRAVEVGIRKVSGAARRELVIQFIGESLIYVALSMVAGIALAELLLPQLNAVLDRSVVFDYWRDPMLAGGIVGLVLLVGVSAGFYPALVLSAFRPAAMLKGDPLQVAGSGAPRQVLVTLQFAILIGITIVTGVVYRQTHFAMNENLRFDSDQVLRIEDACNIAVKTEIQDVPGVRAAACGPLGYNSRVSAPDGTPLGEWTEIIDYEFFDLLGLKPLAGRFFARDRGEDVASSDASTNPNVVINETAARKLGFATPAAAVGQTISWRRLDWDKDIDAIPLEPSRIIGVVADIAMNETVLTSYMPRLYYVDVGGHPGIPLHVKLTGQDIPETLRSIDRIWDRLGDPRWPIRRRFFDQQLEATYHDLRQQEKLFTAFAGVAVFIACLGLFGLAAFTAERRTKEIGIRKAMGASRTDILRLLVWQFTKPVLWANLAAWPVGWFFMNRWLHGFAYHIDLSPWIFLGASALAVVVAVVTVSGHALLVARTHPVVALRYE